jgi:hypothetical protein
VLERGTGGSGWGGMTAIGGRRFGERVDCWRSLDRGVEVRGGGIFGTIVRIVRYRRLGHIVRYDERKKKRDGGDGKKGKEKKNMVK